MPAGITHFLNSLLPNNIMAGKIDDLPFFRKLLQNIHSPLLFCCIQIYKRIIQNQRRLFFFI